MGSAATRAWVSRKRQRTLIEKRLNRRTGDYREKVHTLRHLNGRRSRLNKQELLELIIDGEQREETQT